VLIVCGHLRAVPGGRARLLELSAPAVAAARHTDGCRDYAVSPDLLDPDRVNILELWDDPLALAAFRNQGPDDDLGALIAEYAVREFSLPA
jgi:quinol monooxygenase YgiN